MNQFLPKETLPRSVWAFVGLVVVFAIGIPFVPRIPQPLWYHNFADKRSLLGIPNFGDVASNVPFAIAGLLGLAFLYRNRKSFLDRREMWPYLAVFVGLVLTAFGSSYYHLAPDNARLLWDRIPMTLVFMGLVASVVTERVSARLGTLLLPALLAVGILSVVMWYRSELAGAGDLRLYASVQIFAALTLLTALFLPPRYTRSSDLAAVVGWYVLAKVLETLDRQIFSLGHLVSGHTLKHLAGAAAGYWIVRMVRLRKAIPRPV